MKYKHDVYDVKTCTPILIGATSKEVSEKIGLRRSAVSKYVTKEWVYQKRYKITRYNEDEKIPAQWAREWDAMHEAAKLLREGKGRIVQTERDGEVFRYVEAV